MQFRRWATGLNAPGNAALAGPLPRKNSMSCAQLENALTDFDHICGEGSLYRMLLKFLVIDSFS